MGGAALAGLLLLVACPERLAAPPSGAPAAGAQTRTPARATALDDDGETLAQRYGPAPFLSLLDTGPGVALRDGSALAPMALRAEKCGVCHQAIYNEWRQTTHAAALTDLQYLAELAKPDAPRWLCLNCHIPLQAQRPYLVRPESRVVAKGRGQVAALVEEPNPGFQPALPREAITCATCHVRPGADGLGEVVGPRGSELAPHRVRKDPEALRSICTRCHSPGPVQLTPTFFCWFESAEEVAAGPAAGRTCVECHMPAVERPVAVGTPVRSTRHHFWAGGGVPKHFSDYDGLLARGWEPGVEVAVESVARTREGLEVVVALENRAGGHKVPTGDPERHLRVVARLYDDGGALVGQADERIGQTWDFGDAAQGRPARRLADERLAPGERRTVRLGLPATERGQLVVGVQHIRLSVANARFARAAVLDDELRALRAGAQEELQRLEAHYPLFSWVHYEERDLQTGAVRIDGLAERVARSKAARAWSLERLQGELSDVGPPPPLERSAAGDRLPASPGRRPGRAESR